MVAGDDSESLVSSFMPPSRFPTVNIIVLELLALCNLVVAEGSTATVAGARAGARAGAGTGGGEGGESDVEGEGPSCCSGGRKPSLPLFRGKIRLLAFVNQLLI